MGSDGVLDQSVDGGVQVFRTLQTIRELPEGVRHGAVEHDVDTGDGVGGAQHPELKLVACEGEGGRAVAVRGVPKEPGQRGYAQLHPGALCALIGLLRLNGFEHRRQLVAQEDGDHGGWSLIGAQPVIVPGGGNRCAQKVLVVIHGLNHRAQKQQELGIFVRRLAGGEQVHAGVRGQGPVVVLAGAVDAGKGLFVQQAHHAVPGSYGLHELHGQLIVVGC